MKGKPSEFLEARRERSGEYGTNRADGFNGMFIVQYRPTNATLKIIANDGRHKDADGWEHVSVSLAIRTPFWQEMCFVKELFWNDDECVVQYHPAKSDYVNNHPFCLHLWRNINTPFIKPPPLLVGDKDKGIFQSPEDIEDSKRKLRGR